MKEKIIIVFRIILFILFISFYPYLLFMGAYGKTEGIIGGIGTIVFGITFVVGIITVFIWALKKLKFIKGNF